MLGIVKKIFGTKYDRDVKSYAPLVDQTNDFFEEYESLTNDQLRGKTVEFRERISAHLEGISGDIQSAADEAAASEDFSEKEALYKEIDELTEKRDEHLEEILKELLPEAFAVVKETARRFSENEFVEVTALDHDRDIAASHDYVKVEGGEGLLAKQLDRCGR